MKRIAIVDAEKLGEQEKIAAEVEAFKKRVQAEALANTVKAGSQGESDAVKIRAKASAEAAELQAMSITRLAEANREAGLKEAEVQREKVAASNGKSREILLQETAMAFIQNAPSIIRELMKPAERIGEIKVLQVGGSLGGGMGSNGNGAGQPQLPLLGNALGPVAKTILEASAVMPVLREVMKFANVENLHAMMTPPAENDRASHAAQTKPRVLPKTGGPPSTTTPTEG